MLPIYDRPVIELIVRELASAGVDEVIFVIPPTGSITPNHFSPDERLMYELRKKGKTEKAQEIHDLAHLAKVFTITQLEPLGDGHAILQAEPLIGRDDFFAFFGDEILDSTPSAPVQLLAARENHGGCVLGVQSVPQADIHKFGIVAPANKGDVDNTQAFEIIDFVEKPQPADAPSDLALLGKNLCTAGVFDALRIATPGKGGELRLVDAFLLLLKTEKIFGKKLSGDRFDVGNPDGLLQASLHFSQKK